MSTNNRPAAVVSAELVALRAAYAFNCAASYDTTGHAQRIHNARASRLYLAIREVSAEADRLGIAA